jgi:hypothetical protein
MILLRIQRYLESKIDNPFVLFLIELGAIRAQGIVTRWRIRRQSDPAGTPTRLLARE